MVLKRIFLSYFLYCEGGLKRNE